MMEKAICPIYGGTFTGKHKGQLSREEKIILARAEVQLATKAMEQLEKEYRKLSQRYERARKILARAVVE